MSNKDPRIRPEDTSGQGLASSPGQVLLVFWSSSLHAKVAKMSSCFIYQMLTWSVCTGLWTPGRLGGDRSSCSVDSPKHACRLFPPGQLDQNLYCPRTVHGWAVCYCMLLVLLYILLHSGSTPLPGYVNAVVKTLVSSSNDTDAVMHA